MNNRIKYYLAIAPKIPEPISQETWLQINFGIAIGLVPLFVAFGWWVLTNHFVSKKEHGAFTDLILRE